MVTVKRHAKYNVECPGDLSLGACFFFFILMICVMYQMSWILFCLQIHKHIFSYNDIKFLSETINNELAKLTRWFLANKKSSFQTTAEKANT